MLHLQRPAPATLSTGPTTIGAQWRVETRPRASDPALTGTVTDPRRRLRNQRGQETTLVQLRVEQELGDYQGYSGSPVTSSPGAPGWVIGVLVEQARWRVSPQLGQPAPVANVLFATPIEQVLTEFDLTGVTVWEPAQASQTPAGKPRWDTPTKVAEEVVRALREHDEEGMLRAATPDQARELANFIAERPNVWWVEWQEWADDIVEVRYEYDRIAYAKCGDKVDEDDRFFVMELTKPGSSWYYTGMRYCPRDEWSKYVADPPSGPTVLEVLRTFEDVAVDAREKLGRIASVFPEVSPVEPQQVDGPLIPRPRIAIGILAQREGANTSVLSYAEAISGGREGTDDLSYNPLSNTELLTALFWVDPQNRRKVPWLRERGNWHDPLFATRLQRMLSPTYVVVHRLIVPSDSRLLGRDFYRPHDPVLIDGVFARYETEEVLGSYVVQADDLDSDALYNRTQRALQDALDEVTNGQCDFLENESIL